MSSSSLIPEEPSELSIRLLTARLRSDSENKGVSSKNYAHRLRVIRQQTELLARSPKVAPATMSGDPNREWELTLKKDPTDKQAQVDVGSDASMDASDPPSACQPGGNDPMPSNDFPGPA